MEIKQYQAAIEAIVFASGEPVPISRMAQALELDEDTTARIAADWAQDINTRGGGITALKLDDGYQLCSSKSCADYVRKAFSHLGIRSETKHKAKRTERKAKDPYPNLVFSTWDTVDRPRQVIVSDMTAFYGKWSVYWELTLCFDVFTKQIVGRGLTRQRGWPGQYYEARDQMAEKVAEHARSQVERGDGDVTVFHTDRGSVYTSMSYNELIKETGIVRSCSRAGKPTDNPVNESLNGWIKEELFVDFGLADCEPEDVPGLIDAYGMGETGSCVIRVPGKKYYQVNSDLFVVNVYNEDLSGPALKGMAVITPLYKTELPLINYTSYDQLDSYMRRGLRFARGVQGRMNDVIHHRDGSVTEWGNISGIVNYVPEIISYRIVQEDYENLTLMMVRNPDTPVEKQEEIVKMLDEKLMAMFKDPSFKIKYEWLDEIPADPNGKLRVIVSKVKPGAIGEPEHAGEDTGNAEITEE